ncbi:DUF3164 family protein [Pseudomonas sp. CAN2814]|uniref:DUF3164 family protein n=1 Tax=Pseudomonas sp. CAN1 TaxID=3046726 RepID=UPI002649047B|nr:DUF3164 family protein [Pseudomonas sp. CAN1]MDN6860729.1 DUF3164 family protein [Pseudomonas sp. CAN1]
MNQVTIPEGYRVDAQKRLVAEVLIKPVDLARDQLVMELVGKAKAVQEQLARFKASAFGDVDAFVDLSVEQYGVKRGGKKGNVSLLSFDGRYMIKKAIQETIQFDERIQAARLLIDECLSDWTKGARPEVVTLVSDAFRTDTNGEIRTARVLSLRRLDIQDERWQRAMKAIGEACQTAGSKSYIRVYERVGDSDQYEQISLDLAGV